MSERIIVVCIMSIVMTLAIRVIILCWKWLKAQIERHMEIMENIDSYLWYETEWGKDRRKLKENKEQGNE